MFTKKQDGEFTTYEFAAGGYSFHVFYSPVGYWTVRRERRGAQLRTFGKTFWRATDMAAHYRTAAATLAMIAADSARAA